ncbi:MAG: gfo/Idh/MocA family oxidoreductase [Chloroflexi bacterium]|nr:MAG: gfo/Idh/MocA family oxidoreductase [Chloroflexota bacterium]
MANKILNWGLLSTANINRALIPPLQVSKRNHLLAVASRTQESADKYAREQKIPRAHGSYEALLADPEIDVIYNSLPNHLHAEWTIKAVEAGKHVLCEKPIALNVDDVDAIKSAARKHERVVMEAFMYRHHPQTLKVQELVKSGSLGALKLIRGSFSYILNREGNIRVDPSMGGGSLWDVGCYPISYARSVIGKDPLEVFGWQVPGQTGTDDTFIGQLRFDHDVYAQFDCSFIMPFHVSMEFIGSEGTLIVPEPYKPYTDEKIYLRRDEKTETIKIKGQELYLGEVEDMADAILLGHDPRISLDDSRANVAVVLGLLESARSGKSVSVNY